MKIDINDLDITSNSTSSSNPNINSDGYIRESESSINGRVYKHKKTGQLISEETKTVNGTQVKIYRNFNPKGNHRNYNYKTGKRLDVHVYVTENTRQDLITHVGNKHFTPAQSCLAYIMQNAIANYQGRVDAVIKEREDNLEENHHIIRRKNLMDDLNLISKDFVALERLMNNPPSLDPQENINALSEAIIAFNNAITAKIATMLAKTWSENLSAQAEIENTLKALQLQIKSHVERFEKQIKDLKETNPTSREVTELFQLQNTSLEWTLFPNKQSLGTFEKNCMMNILSAGIAVSQAIKEEKFTKRLKSHAWESESVKELSRAKAAIREKFSLAGMEYNTAYKVPDDMIAVLQSPEAPEPTDEKKWLSLQDYCENWNILETDPIFCRIFGQDLTERTLPSIGYDALKWAAIIPDAIYGGVRAGFEVGLFGVTGSLYLLEYIASWPLYPLSYFSIFQGAYHECITHHRLINRANQAQSTLSETHKRFSSIGLRAALEIGLSSLKTAEYLASWFLWPVSSFGFFENAYKECVGHDKLSAYIEKFSRSNDEKISITSGIFGAQRLWLNHYTHTNNTNNEYEDLLKELDEPVNGIHHFLDTANPVKFIRYVGKQLSALQATGERFISEIWNNPLSPYTWLKTKIFRPRKLTKESQAIEMRQYLTFMREMSKKMYPIKEEQPLVATDDAEDFLQNSSTSTRDSSASFADDDAAAAVAKYYPSPVPSKTTNIEHSLSVPIEIFQVLNKVIDHAFRESPGPATAFCTFAIISFGTCVIPIAALGPAAKAVAMGIQKPAAAVAHSFMGQSLTQASAQVGSNFLIWKLAFFTTEAGKAVTTGDTEFLRKIFKNPEFFIMGAMVCIAAGMTVGHFAVPIPMLPPVLGEEPPGMSLFREIFNGVLEEASYTRQGTPGLTALEDGFIGLKFFMFLHSMISGNQKHDYDEKQMLNMLELVRALQKRGRKETLTDQNYERIIKEEINKLRQLGIIGFDEDFIYNAYHTVYFAQPTIALEYDEPTSLLTDLKVFFVDKKTRIAAFGDRLWHGTKEKIDDDVADNTEELTKKLAEIDTHLEQVITDLEENPQIFAANGETAERIFNYIDDLIEQHNQIKCALHQDHELINKADIMRDIYTQNDPGKPNLLGLIYIFVPAVYLLGVVPWRFYKSPPAFWNNFWGTETSPYVAAQVRKDFYKDGENVLQLIGAIIAGTGYTMGKITEYVARPILFIPALIAIGTITALSSPFIKQDTSINHIFRKTDKLVRNFIPYTLSFLPVLITMAAPVLITRVVNKFRGIENTDTEGFISLIKKTHRYVRDVRITSFDPLGWLGLRKLCHQWSIEASNSVDFKDTAAKLRLQAKLPKEIIPNVERPQVNNEGVIATITEEENHEQNNEEHETLLSDNHPAADVDTSLRKKIYTHTYDAFFPALKKDELLDTKKTAKQQATLEKMARLKATGESDVDKYTPLLHKLPRNFRPVVEQQYMPKTRRQ